jgi:acyl-coenzyme A synthetase/AMP-(fatty) acid ligase
MNLKILNDGGSINLYEINNESLFDNELTDKVSYISSKSKEQNAIKIFKSYFSGAKSILFDESNRLLVDKLNDLNICEYDNPKTQNTIFDNKDFSFIYFTSGSTGASTAALKTKKNIESEIKALSELLNKYEIKKVVVTVPFIHIYGSLAGLFYPYFNNIDIVLREHFLPNDLLDIIDENTLVVTTPLYIKALNKISSVKDLSKSLFLSSTAPLGQDDAKMFNEKFFCDIMQLFGSTETGGIAYKFNDEILWTPLNDVNIKTNEKNELKVISPFVSQELYENDFQFTNGEIQTFDFIELLGNRFKLIGRSSQILKIAGKRYSTIQIENILESQINIAKALVYVKNDKNSLRGEVLDITLETTEEFSSKEIKKILQSNLSNLKFSMDLKCVSKIPTSSVGKKLRIDI